MTSKPRPEDPKWYRLHCELNDIKQQFPDLYAVAINGTSWGYVLGRLVELGRDEDARLMAAAIRDNTLKDFADDEIDVT